MKREGIRIEELDGVEEVIIRLSDREIRFVRPSVTMMIVHGQQTYQIMGVPVESRGGEEGGLPDEDVKLVMEHAHVSREEALAALQECDGNPAEAILKLTQKG